MTTQRRRTHPSFLVYPETVLPPLFIVSTCIKVLVIPSYRSTDFDVHRNWLAITRQTPIHEWYWNDVDGRTVHTLDYPPVFAFFQYLLSNNPIPDRFLPPGDRCLDLLPDTDNEPSEACVLFQRSTVIVSDCVLWAGAYYACSAYHYKKPLNHAMTSFLLIVLNPGFLWLDHIHFQYNGMLLGVLLASLGCIMMGNNVSVPSTTANPNPRQPLSYHFYHLLGAAIFALLLNMKHLYLALAPMYFCYLLEKYCLTPHVPTGKTIKQLLFFRFLVLALVTATVLVVPWMPFVRGHRDPFGQVIQMFKRLFPFGRGFVHDYWAGNVWAVYKFLDRVFLVVVRHLVPRLRPFLPKIANLLEGSSLPEPSPLFCALSLVVSIIPGLQMASLSLTNKKLIEAVVYVSFCSFMLAYHVHEKAIMTAIIPLTLLVEPNPRKSYYNVLFWYAALWGLLGLFPLLFRPVEFTLKVSSYLCYMALVSYMLRTPPRWMEDVLAGTWGMVAFVIALLDVAPIQGKWEFFPLMATSVSVAFGLMGCWATSYYLLVRLDPK